MAIPIPPSFWLSPLWRIGRIVVPALLLVAAFLWVRGIIAERDRLRDWRGEVVQVVKAEVPVARRKTVTAETTGDEIRWLGRELRTNSEALRIQSERLVIAKRHAGAAREAAATALERAKERDKAREATRTRLTDPKRSEGLTAAEWGEL